ncbi:MAG: arylesterase [Gammaproteobacteria bacterium]|nr:MAG: arylesterase [Gammaproteobacteria bacterium]
MHYKNFYIFLLILISNILFANKDYPNLLIYGDSISAGYGMSSDKQWSVALQEIFDVNKIKFQIINKSLSGETTGGGLVRLKRIIEEFQPVYILLELGGNDALRGYPPLKVKQNLEAMISMAKNENVKVLLMQIKIPPNYGKRYQESFESIYSDIARDSQVELIPFMLENVALNSELMFRDGIHPNEKAQPLIADYVYKSLTPHLKQ